MEGKNKMDDRIIKEVLSYAELSEEEQGKDKVQVMQAQAKVQAYVDGLVDVEKLCTQYGIQDSGRNR